MRAEEALMAVTSAAAVFVFHCGNRVVRAMVVVLWALTLLVLAEVSARGQDVFPTVFVDNSLGSTIESGAPEAFGPITALAACHTNGAPSTTIEWPSHGITGLSTTGDAVLRLGTSSGRRFSVITSVPDGDTVVVADNFNIAAVSAVDCGVGGRLLNLTPELAADVDGDSGGTPNGWQVFIVETGVNYVWTAPRVSAAASSGCGFYGSSGPGDPRPIVECTFQPGTCLTVNTCDVKGMEFRNTNGTKTGTVGLINGDFSTVENNIIGGPAAATAFETGIGAHTGQVPSYNGNLVRNNDIGYFAAGASDSLVRVTGNVFESNVNGVEFNTTATAHYITGNIFWSNTVGMEINLTAYNQFNVIGWNTFHDNATGMSITDPAGIFSLLFASNLVTNNTVGTAYSGAARDQERESALIDFNCYGNGSAANGTANSGFIRGANTISIDPEYEDAATGDFTPTTQDVLFRAWPPGLDGGTPRNFIGTTTPSEIACGAIQPADGGGIRSAAF